MCFVDVLGPRESDVAADGVDEAGSRFRYEEQCEEHHCGRRSIIMPFVGSPIKVMDRDTLEFKRECDFVIPRAHARFRRMPPGLGCVVCLRLLVPLSGSPAGIATCKTRRAVVQRAPGATGLLSLIAKAPAAARSCFLRAAAELLVHPAQKISSHGGERHRPRLV